MSERLQKTLANLGLGSRRTIESWISEGRISVNGEIAKLGCTIDGDERITLDGQPVELENTPFVRRVLAYYKPIGEVTTRSDPEGRSTIFDNLPPIKNGRWITIGRLDINTQGLLLITNDGALAHELMHPSNEIEREYAVRVLGTLTEEMVTNLTQGVAFEDGISKFDEILWSGGEGANIWYHVILKGGKNREVRRLWESQGLTVSRLIRVRYGTVTLPRSLRPGQSIDLEEDALKELAASVNITHHKNETYQPKTEHRSKIYKPKQRRQQNSQPSSRPPQPPKKDPTSAGANRRAKAPTGTPARRTSNRKGRS